MRLQTINYQFKQAHVPIIVQFLPTSHGELCPLVPVMYLVRLYFNVHVVVAGLSEYLQDTVCNGMNSLRFVKCVTYLLSVQLSIISYELVVRHGAALQDRPFHDIQLYHFQQFLASGSMLSRVLRRTEPNARSLHTNMRGATQKYNITT